MITYRLLAVSLMVLAGCTRQRTGNEGQTEQEDLEAKQSLQGIWVEPDGGIASMCAKGDTIYFPDSTMPPSPFRVVSDSLCMGRPERRYAILKLTAEVFCFENQAGDSVLLHRSNSADDTLYFSRRHSSIEVPKAVTSVQKQDGVAVVGQHRLHWYVAINPTRYRVSHTSYSDDGVAVENIFFDNIIHLSVYEGRHRLFSQDVRKKDFSGVVPESFLSSAVLGDMSFNHADERLLHFDVKLCIPDAASCYLIDLTVALNGETHTKVLEY